MPIEILWDNPQQTIIHAKGISWTTEEFHIEFDAITKMIRHSDTHIEGIIVENCDGEYSKRDYMSAFKRVVRIGEITTVFVNLNPMQKLMLQSVLKIYKSEKSVFIVDTVDEAREIILSRAMYR